MLVLQERIRKRVLRYLHRHGALDEHSAAEMLGWDHGGGFSLDASRRVESWDRQGLERLCRYCARPALALSRLEQVDESTLVISKLVDLFTPPPVPAGPFETP